MSDEPMASELELQVDTTIAALISHMNVEPYVNC